MEILGFREDLAGPEITVVADCDRYCDGAQASPKSLRNSVEGFDVAYGPTCGDGTHFGRFMGYPGMFVPRGKLGRMGTRTKKPHTVTLDGGTRAM